MRMPPPQLVTGPLIIDSCPKIHFLNAEQSLAGENFHSRVLKSNLSNPTDQANARNGRRLKKIDDSQPIMIERSMIILSPPSASRLIKLCPDRER